MSSAAAGKSWTPQQLEAIRASGQSLLVSAAAGSGKTSVLAQRCVHLICDAEPRCSVSQLLVVTFTEAAAMEMKSRIDTALRQRLAKEPGNGHLQRQLALVDHAPISTLHSFCSKIIRQNFHRLGLDPAFRVMDDDEAGLLRLEVARDLFMECYDSEEATAFRQFVDDFGAGEDEPLIKLLVGTHEMLRSLVDPAKWLAAAQARISEAIAKPLEQSEMGREYLALIQERIGDVQRDMKTALASMAKNYGLKPYIGYLQNLAAVVGDWEGELKTKGYDALVAAVGRYSSDKLPSVSGSIDGKDAAKSLVDDVRDRMKDKCLRFTTAQWQTGLKSIEAHTRTFVALVEEFAKRYEREKKSDRAVDFGDLERHALELLCDGEPAGLQPSDAARLFHKQYQHVLVDEYQDINEIQDAILTLVSRECVCSASGAGTGSKLPVAQAQPAGKKKAAFQASLFDGAPDVKPAAQMGSRANLFCVGDVKQSIYAFRLADPTRFLNRMEGYRAAGSHGRVIDLQANFRSRKPLLDSVNEVFARLMTEAAVDVEYDQSHRLDAKAQFPAATTESFAGAPIELHLLPEKLESEDGDDEGNGDDIDAERSQREAMLVARRIEELMGMHGKTRMYVADRDPSGAAVLRPIEYRDVVILLRATKFHAEDYSQVLRQRGIPVFNDGGGGFFNAIEIRDVISLLRLLDNQRQDIPLAAVLRSPLANLPAAEDSLARIRITYPTSVHPIPFHEAALRYASEQDDELAAHLRDFFADLEKWRTLSRQQPIAQLIWSIYEESGYLAFNSGLHDGPQRVANLIFLYEKARSFGNFSRQGLYRFIQYLESLREEMDAAQSPQVGEAEDAVRILSIHRSKGLEFPVVFLPELGKRINFQSSGGFVLAEREAKLGMTAIDGVKRIRYPSLASVVVENRLRRQTLAEEMRILYVAMTRAKEHLILSGTCDPKLIQEWSGGHAGRIGAMPANIVHSANTMLDWVGPVWAMDAKESFIRLHRHEVEEVRKWLDEHDPSKPRSLPPENLANLRPLTPAPAADVIGAEVIARLTREYAFEPYTTMPASQPLTAVAKSGALPVAEADDQHASSGKALADPPFLLGQRPLSPEDRGTATHLFLEHLDFSQPPQSLEQQLQRLLERKIITREQAEAVNLDDVRWLLESPVGALLRAKAGEILRELPINFSHAQSGVPDPLDRTMLRGRIDLLVPDDRGFVLIDYKTDDVRSSDLLRLRGEFYAPQLALYSQAITQITGRPVHTAHLAFLSARQIVTTTLASR